MPALAAIGLALTRRTTHQTARAPIRARAPSSTAISAASAASESRAYPAAILATAGPSTNRSSTIAIAAAGTSTAIAAPVSSARIEPGPAPQARSTAIAERRSLAVRARTCASM